MSTNHKVTLHTLAGLKATGQKATLGLPNTLGIGLSEMLVFAKAVSRAAHRALVIGDMPFLSYQPADETAVRSAGAFQATAVEEEQ